MGIETALLMEYFYIYIFFLYNIFLWAWKHRGSYPILSKSEDYELLCFLMHVLGITSRKDLQDDWGIKVSTLKSYYAKEMRNYIKSHPDHPKSRTYRKGLADEINRQSYLKLDEAIRARAECAKSVQDFYLHRGQP